MNKIGKISVVITCHGEAPDLPNMVSSLQLQREYNKGRSHNDKHDVYYVAGKPCTHPLEIIVVCDGPFQGYVQPEAKLIIAPKKGGVGHHTREYGIQAATGEWIVLTNDDNYFVKGWLHAMTKNILPDTGVLYWNCINNLWRWGDHGGSKIIRGYIDLSCALVRTEIAKEVGFPFRNYDGDFDYIHACVASAKKKNLMLHYLDQTLCVHC